VYESTFVGLQGLAAVHAPGSEVLAAAEAALVGLLGSFAGQLRAVYGDEVLYQVGCMLLEVFYVEFVYVCGVFGHGGKCGT
jgi:hypothetical protein